MPGILRRATTIASAGSLAQLEIARLGEENYFGLYRESRAFRMRPPWAAGGHGLPYHRAFIPIKRRFMPHGNNRRTRAAGNYAAGCASQMATDAGEIKQQPPRVEIRAFSRFAFSRSPVIMALLLFA